MQSKLNTIPRTQQWMWKHTDAFSICPSRHQNGWLYTCLWTLLGLLLQFWWPRAWELMSKVFLRPGSLAPGLQSVKSLRISGSSMELNENPADIHARRTWSSNSTCLAGEKVNVFTATTVKDFCFFFGGSEESTTASSVPLSSPLSMRAFFLTSSGQRAQLIRWFLITCTFPVCRGAASRAAKEDHFKKITIRVYRIIPSTKRIFIGHTASTIWLRTSFSSLSWIILSSHLVQ